MQLNDQTATLPEDFRLSLVVLCAYRGRINDPLPVSAGWRAALKNRLTLVRLRLFIAQWRDFYANPRSLEYCLALAGNIKKRGHADARVLLDADWDQSAPQLGQAMTREKLTPERLAAEAAGGAIVLIYPDALGLGWGPFEGALRQKGIEPFVLNGRQRLFRLDNSARWALLWRRFLAQTRIVELIMAFLLAPTAWMLALADRIDGRK